MFLASILPLVLVLMFSIFDLVLMLIPVPLFAWILATAIGLVEFKQWARASIIVLSALAVIVGAPIGALLVVAPMELLYEQHAREDPPEETFVVDTSHPDHNVEREIRQFQIRVGLLFAIPVSICVWMLHYFSRQDIESMFESAKSTPTH
jgi:hypothetical protein